VRLQSGKQHELPGKRQGNNQNRYKIWARLGAEKILLRRGNQWVILAGFQLGILLDLIFMRGRKETIELAA